MCGILGFITKNSYKKIITEKDGIQALNYLQTEKVRLLSTQSPEAVLGMLKTSLQI